MGLLDTIKALLGMESTDQRQGREDVGVTVERDTRDVETETESAVKSPADEVDESDDDETEVEIEAAADEADEADETTDLVEEAEPEDEAEEEPEPEPEAEAEDEAEEEPESEPEAEAEDEDEPEDEPEPEPETETEDEAEAEPDAESDSPEILKGIGPAYARRLGEAGIDTVADLAAADPETVAEEIDVSVKRVSRWVDRAKEY